MTQRLAIFCDGTRNTREDETNVHRLYEKVRRVPRSPDGVEQVAWYHAGLGTRTSDFFTGAAFGRGVSRDVRDVYEWLRAHWREGDSIFLFGFSRGAFTARSLAGFLAHFGMLRRGASLDEHDLYSAYRSADDARPLYRLVQLQREDAALTRQPNEARRQLELQLLRESRVVPIDFIGVWDTVGSIGLPVGHLPRISSSENRFHTLEPRAIFRRCCHALAVDERRPHYRPILWKRFVLAEKLLPDGTAPADAELESRYEQRWFVGAHSNVGGGYRDPSPLYKVSLKWMEDRAAEAGLGIADRETLDGTEHLAPIDDSFADFLPYKIAFWTREALRPVLRPGEPKDARNGVRGSVFVLGEVVDDTVRDRLRRGGADGTPYAPANLKHLAP
jgi:uncharacterized protein (DUF2235 family)